MNGGVWRGEDGGTVFGSNNGRPVSSQLTPLFLRHQDVCVFKSGAFGTVLVLDGTCN